MKTLGTLLLAIGLWYGLAFGVGFILDPSGMRDPVVQGAAIDGVFFAALGACLLGLSRLSRRKEPVEPPEQSG
jgi:hypothetical protein